MKSATTSEPLHAGTVWAYRLVLNREPNTLEAQAVDQKLDRTDRLIRSLIKSDEFATRLERPDFAEAELSPTEMRNAARWTFKLLLSREVGDEATLQAFVHGRRTLAELRRIVVFSDEFRVLNDKSLFPLLIAEVVRDFKPFPTNMGDSGSFKDFLGNTTRCSFLPPGMAALSGGRQGPPGSNDNPPMHDVAEWIGTLRAALDAKDRFVAVELGAGWAPWLISGRRAALLLGITEIHLLGVEGSLEHVQFMRQNFLDNGIDPDLHQLIYGVVGVSDGVARFPVLSNPESNYGSAADYTKGETSGEMIELPSFSLTKLLQNLPPIIDLIHCDIQGGEAEVMGASLSTLRSRVRRVVIGTHGRKIEGELLEHFSSIGWKLEFESVCTYRQDVSGHLALAIDGVQIWRNPDI